MTEHFTNPSNEILRNLLVNARSIALVGASSKESRPSHAIMRDLLDAGFHVIPVTPKESVVLGQKAYATLAEIPEPVDIVDVFVRAEGTPPIATDAAAIRAKALWLQLGIASDEAARIAADAGLIVVMDKCLGTTVRKLGISRLRSGRAADPVEEAGTESFPASDPPAWG